MFIHVAIGLARPAGVRGVRRRLRRAVGQPRPGPDRGRCRGTGRRCVASAFDGADGSVGSRRATSPGTWRHANRRLGCACLARCPPARTAARPATIGPNSCIRVDALPRRHQRQRRDADVVRQPVRRSRPGRPRNGGRRDRRRRPAATCMKPWLIPRPLDRALPGDGDVDDTSRTTATTARRELDTDVSTPDNYERRLDQSDRLPRRTDGLQDRRQSTMAGGIDPCGHRARTRVTETGDPTRERSKAAYDFTTSIATSALDTDLRQSAGPTGSRSVDDRCVTMTRRRTLAISATGRRPRRLSRAHPQRRASSPSAMFNPRHLRSRTMLVVQHPDLQYREFWH